VGWPGGVAWWGGLVGWPGGVAGGVAGGVRKQTPTHTNSTLTVQPCP